MLPFCHQIDSRTQSGYRGNSKCVWCFSLKVNTQPCSSMFFVRELGVEENQRGCELVSSAVALSKKVGVPFKQWAKTRFNHGLRNKQHLNWLTERSERPRLPVITWRAVMLTRESRSRGWFLDGTNRELKAREEWDAGGLKLRTCSTIDRPSKVCNTWQNDGGLLLDRKKLLLWLILLCRGAMKMKVNWNGFISDCLREFSLETLASSDNPKTRRFG